MGLWTGSNPSIKSGEEEAQVVQDIRRKMAAEDAAARQAKIKEIEKAGQQVVPASRQVGRELGQAVSAGFQQRPDFSREQRALQQMFGHGEKIWGVNNQPVTIHNDLNPSRQGDDGTASLFGFGRGAERSGMF